METKYFMTVKTPDGKIKVEVSKEIYDFDKENKAYMAKIEKREGRHTYSLESASYEGENYGYYDTYPSEELERLREKTKEARNCRKVISKLTETQKRRLTMYSNGDTYQEIAEKEGVNLKSAYESVQSAIRKCEKFFKNTPKSL